MKNAHAHRSLTKLTRNFSGTSIDTTPTFDEPPIRTLMYPVTDRLQWDHPDYGPTKIRKQYDGFGNVSVQSSNYFCSMVKRNWYFNFTSTPDTNFILTDYFSASGMIKRDFVIKNVLATYTSGDPLEYNDVVEQSVQNLVSIS
jgi:hypothetical protein